MRRSLRTATLATVFLLLFAMLPNHCSAVPYITEGYVKYANGTPFPHATLEVFGPVFNVSTGNIEEASVSFEDATDSSGYFRILFGVNEPAGFSTGDTVTLRLVDNNYTVSSEFEIEGHRTWVNLTVGGSNGDGGFDLLDFILSPAGVGVISVIVIVMVAAVYMYRSSEKSEETEKEEARRKVGRRRQ